MQLAIDGWIYAVHQAEKKIRGVCAENKPVSLAENGLIRFRRDGSLIQPFVSSSGSISDFRSLGDLRFAASCTDEGDSNQSYFLQYGVFPGRQLDSFPPLPAMERATEAVGEFVYLQSEGSERKLIAQLSGLRTIFQAPQRLLFVRENKGSISVGQLRRKDQSNEGEAVVNFDSLRDLELFPLLGANSAVTRKEAVFEILRRKRPWKSEVETLLQDRQSPSYLPSLAPLSQREGDRTFALLSDAARLSHQAGAFRLLGDRDEAENHPVLAEINRATDPEVTTEILAAIARSGSTISGLDELVLQFAAVDHELLSSTALEWLVENESFAICFDALDDPQSSSAIQEAAFEVLVRLPKTSVVEGILSRLELTNDREFRKQSLLALGDLYFVDAQEWQCTPRIDGFLRASLSDRRVDSSWLLDQMLQREIPVNELDDIIGPAAHQMPLQPAAVEKMLALGRMPASAIPWLNSIVNESSHDPSFRAKALALLNQQLPFATALKKTAELLNQKLIPSAEEALRGSWKRRSDVSAHSKQWMGLLKEERTAISILAAQVLQSIGMDVSEAPPSDPEEIDWYEAGHAAFHRLNCHHCHNVHGEGDFVGPDLVEWIARSSDLEFERAVLNPSKSINPDFRSHIIELKNGSLLEGIVKQEQAGHLTLADSASNMIELSQELIASRRLSKR
ncbi:MAG: hypothetical protein AAF357_16075, partial [Verrucomicrobiota bacterium]